MTLQRGKTETGLVVEMRSIEIIIRMAIETPAKIAIIGAGPIGLEAALYARFLGYETELFERGSIAERFRNSNTNMPAPFREISTPLALAAMEAQGDYEPPPEESVLTGGEFVDQYLAPLAKTDLIRGEIRTECEVVAVRRADPSHHSMEESNDENNDEEREEEGDAPTLSIQFRNADGTEDTASAHVVIDASGRDLSATTADLSFFKELEIDFCKNTGTFLGVQTGFDVGREQLTEPVNLISNEPNVYVLGSKSFGWGFDFTLRDGHEQIQGLFSILGDRADLDLYRSIRPLGG